MAIFSWLCESDSVATVSTTNTFLILAHVQPCLSLTPADLGVLFTLLQVPSLSLSLLIDCFWRVALFWVFCFMLHPCYLLSEWIFVDPCLKVSFNILFLELGFLFACWIFLTSDAFRDWEELVYALRATFSERERESFLGRYNIQEFVYVMDFLSPFLVTLHLVFSIQEKDWTRLSENKDSSNFWTMWTKVI